MLDRFVKFFCVLISTTWLVSCDDDKSVDSGRVANGSITVPDDHGGTKTTNYRNGIRHGSFEWLREDGGIYVQGEYREGEKHGIWLYDDVFIRFATHYEGDLKCGEERRWTDTGDAVVLRETRFYLDDDQIATGEWRCAETGEDCVRWEGIWFSVESDQSTGQSVIYRRTYDSGTLTSEEIVDESSNCYLNLFP